ncbi:MAG: hypothetical protein KGH56_00830 [Patescibacteria group bacterium]|nr:hypothetical protein [Patescibacteria group bacterium]
MKIPGLENPATPEEVRRILHNPAFDEYVIGTTGRWRVYLNIRDQRFLGRCYAWLVNGKHADLLDLGDLSEEEAQSLFGIVRRFRTAVENLWGATHVNYGWLGNETRIHRGHGHLHMTPRYFGGAPSFCGLSFPDPCIGKNSASSFPLKPGEEVLLPIRDALRKEMKLA